MSTAPTTLVLLDPSSGDGESALDLLTDADDHVALVVLLTGSMSRSLRDFARAEDTDLTTVGWIYLDQVVARLGAGSPELETILAQGPNSADELVNLSATRVIRRVLLPASIERVDRPSRDRMRSTLSAPIMVANAAANAGRWSR